MSLSKKLQDQHPEYTNIERLLETHYAIPKYQRSFSWKKEQVIDLIESIREVCEENEKLGNTLTVQYNNYLGPIMIASKLENEDVEDSKVMYVVDGQQRLITIILLLYALKKRILESINSLTANGRILDPKERKQSDGFIRIITDSIMENDLLADPGMNPIYKFVPNDKRDREALENILSDRASRVRSSSKIGKAFEVINKQLDELVKADFFKRSTTHLVRYMYIARNILVNTYVLKTALSTPSNAYAIFESLNTTGLQLSPFDLINGFIVSECQKSRNSDLQKKWEDEISKYKDTDINLEDYIFYWWQSKGYDTPKIDLFNAIKDYVNRRGLALSVDEIVLNFDYLNILLNGPSTYVSTYISMLKRKKIIPLYLAMKENRYRSDTIDEILGFLIRYSVIELNLLGKSPGTFQYKIKKILSHIRSVANTSIAEIKSTITEVGSDYSSYQNKDIFVDITTGVNQDDVLYKALYLMIFESENGRTVLPNFDVIDIEHLFPRNPSDDWWNFPIWNAIKNDDDIRNRTCHSIGNMILLDQKINRSIKNKYIEDKKVTITAALSAALSSAKWNQIDFDQFSPSYIESRTKAIVAYIKANDPLQIT